LLRQILLTAPLTSLCAICIHAQGPAPYTSTHDMHAAHRVRDISRPRSETHSSYGHYTIPGSVDIKHEGKRLSPSGGNGPFFASDVYLISLGFVQYEELIGPKLLCQLRKC
jgi:hypothetical protein